MMYISLKNCTRNFAENRKNFTSDGNHGNMGLSEHGISNIKVFMSNAFFCSAIMSAFVSNAMTNEPLNEG